MLWWKKILRQKLNNTYKGITSMQDGGLLPIFPYYWALYQFFLREKYTELYMR